MGNIDWDAYILNRTLGTDVPTSIAGAIEDQQPPAPSNRDRRSRSLGMLIGVGAFLACTIYRSLRRAAI